MTRVWPSMVASRYSFKPPGKWKLASVGVSSVRAFSVQVRIAYLAVLATGLWPPLGFVHWLQLAGTMAQVGFDYCPLARLVSLMPWNRTQPLTFRLVWRTFALPPMSGSVLGTLGN